MSNSKPVEGATRASWTVKSVHLSFGYLVAMAVTNPVVVVVVAVAVVLPPVNQKFIQFVHFSFYFLNSAPQCGHLPFVLQRFH